MRAPLSRIEHRCLPCHYLQPGPDEPAPSTRATRSCKRPRPLAVARGSDPGSMSLPSQPSSRSNQAAERSPRRSEQGSSREPAARRRSLQTRPTRTISMSVCAPGRTMPRRMKNSVGMVSTPAAALEQAPDSAADPAVDRGLGRVISAAQFLDPLDEVFVRAEPGKHAIAILRGSTEPCAGPNNVKLVSQSGRGDHFRLGDAPGTDAGKASATPRAERQDMACRGPHSRSCQSAWAWRKSRMPSRRP